MKLGKTTETILIFLSALVILFTGLLAMRQILGNWVNDTYEKTLSLGGARLSDDVYITVNRISQQGVYKRTPNNYETRLSVSADRFANTIYKSILGEDTADAGDGFTTRLVLTLHNNSEQMIKNWRAYLLVPPNTEIIDNWKISAYIDDGRLILNPLDDLSLASGQDVEFGIVIRTGRTYNPTELTLYGYGSYVQGSTIYEKIIYSGFVVWAILFVGYFVSRFNFKNYREKQKNDVKIILQSMNTFIRFIDAKDPYTRGHSTRVAMYAAEIAKRMHLSEDEVQNVYYAGLLHDAGKISIPDAVLNKPGKLSDEERKQIQDHTVAGGKMLKQLTALRGIRETALYHHERYDGTGYPEGLKKDAIPLYARIVGVADSYDAMSSNRVYRRHLNKDEIIEQIQKGSGSQFDPAIVVYMVDMINDGYVNVVKMETAENEDSNKDFHITEDDIPGVYMGL
ncbi:MAG: HD domain-containing protein [Butyrivibrio sp.]|nr:HD domain-containing protein [Butyrivibrio sp.]